MNNLKLKNFVFVVIFSIFFYVTQNIFLPLQKFYINLELTSLDIFLELIKFIILNLFLFKINNKNIKHFFIFLSFFIYLLSWY